jgi:hypothetical protein
MSEDKSSFFSTLILTHTTLYLNKKTHRHTMFFIFIYFRHT